MSTLPERINADLAAVAAEARAGLVQIADGRRGFGSGTLCHPDGLIVTNAHVVRGKSPRVRLRDGRSLQARVIASDDELDLAALAVEGDRLPHIELGDSRDLLPGQVVFALGNPFGVAGAVTAGVIVGSGPIETMGGRDLLVVDMPLRPGHSGGPLVDTRGRLLGINVMMAGPDVGLAVPVHAVKRFLADGVSSKIRGLTAA